MDSLTNNNSCSTTNNHNVLENTFSITQKSHSYFSSGTSSFPFTEGVVLSTWSIRKAVGPVTDAGTYKVVITLNPKTCYATDEIKIEYTPEIVLNNTTLIQCDDNGDGLSTFELIKVDP